MVVVVVVAEATVTRIEANLSEVHSGLTGAISRQVEVVQLWNIVEVIPARAVFTLRSALMSAAAATPPAQLLLNFPTHES